MSEKEKQLLIEKERLANVLKIIEESLSIAFESFINRGRGLTKEYEALWNAKGDIDEIEYKERKQVLEVHEQIERHQVKKIRTLEKLKKAPYFGRIDFIEEGYDEIDKIYIGIGSLFDEENLEVIIYDWRTPICSMYYEYSLGKASFSSDVDFTSGNILKKRQYKIENGELVYLFDTDITIDDEVLQRMLSQPMNDKMKNIISTIQKEQNKIIRNDQFDILVVQGPAGSGKTSVALHRIAYLLYKHRKTLQSNEIVIFSPNEIFSDYISEVLPELGEEKVQQTTFGTYFKTYFYKDYKIQTFDDHMGFMMGEEESEIIRLQKEAIAYKASWDFCKVIDDYINYILCNNMHFKNIVFRENRIMNKAEIEDLFYNHYAILPPERRLKRIKKRIDKLLEPILNKRLEEIKERVAEEKADIAGLSFFEEEVNEVSWEILQNEFTPLKFKIKSMTSFDYNKLYEDLFMNDEFVNEISKEIDLPQEFRQFGMLIKDRRLDGEVAYEDLAPILYIQFTLTGTIGMPVIKYVIIDEAQDYSPIQYKLFAKGFERSKFTILGDINQIIHPYMNIGEYEECLRLFGNKKSIFMELRNSYRCTKQIGAFSDGILLQDQNIKHLNRNGERVNVTKVEKEKQHHDEVIKTIHSFIERQYNHIGVIGRNNEECLEIYNALKDKLNVNLITNGEADFSKGISILPLYLAKGLEFEGVILYNANAKNYYSESHRKLLYTAVTRALHQLHIFSRGELSPFIASMDKLLYNLRNL